MKSKSSKKGISGLAKASLAGGRGKSAAGSKGKSAKTSPKKMVEANMKGQKPGIGGVVAAGTKAMQSLSKRKGKK